MKDTIFNELLESVAQAGQIRRGERKPARVFRMDAPTVRAIRESLQFSQTEFAGLMHVSVKTLRNWEQGVRTPDGAAAALLTAIQNDPENVLRALNA